MSVLLMITFFLSLGYINLMSVPIQMQQKFEPDDILTDTSDILDYLSNDLRNNEIGLKKYLHKGNNFGQSYISDGISAGTVVKKQSENNKNWRIGELFDTTSNGNCDKKCYIDNKLYDDDYETLIEKFKLMEQLLTSLGPNLLEALNNIGVNSSGRREGPLYAEEPKYVVIPKDIDDETLELLLTAGSNRFKDFFIPPRGRKQMPILQKLRNHYELFVPNRGKKTKNIKKDKIKDIFKYNDLFFPNRGKKSFYSDTLNTSKK